MLKPENRKWVSFFAIGFGLFTAVLDASMLGIALPQIGRDFSLDLSKVSWISLVSTITIVATLMPIGNVSDRVGRKFMYLSGVLIMGISSLLCAISPNLYVLLILRVIVSVGAAMRMSTGLAMVMMIFGEKERGKGLGANTTTVGLAAISGPIIGGLLVTNFGWASVFLIQSILTIPVFFLGFFLLDTKIVDESTKKFSGSFDYLGSIVSGLAFTVLLFSVNLGLTSFTFPYIFLSFFIVLILFSLFLFIETKVSNPILDVSLLKNYNFSFSISTRLFGFLAGSSTLFLMPFYIQMIKGLPADQAGFLIFPGAVGMALSASVSGRFSDRFGEKPFIIVGLIMILVASFLFSTFTPQTSNSFIITILLFHGLGMGIWATPNGSQTVSLVPKQLYGSVAAIINLIRTIGMGTSIAIASSVITISFINFGLDPNFSTIDGGAFGQEKAVAFMKGFKNTYITLMVINLISIVCAVIAGPKRNILNKE